MSIIKITEEGESYVGTVKLCAVTQGQYGEQVQFDFQNGDRLYLPKDSADRQLGRIPLEYADCLGVSLKFSRDPNPKKGSKPYWGIALADVVDRQPAPSKRLTAQDAANAKPHTGPLPTQPFDEPTAAERAEAMERELSGDDGFAEFSESVDAVAKPSLASQKEAAYNALYARVAKFQAQTAAEYQFPFDAASITAQTFSIAKGTGLI
jgi:hypothetical protein